MAIGLVLILTLSLFLGISLDFFFDSESNFSGVRHFLSKRQDEGEDRLGAKKREGKLKKWVRERLSQKGSKTCVLAKEVVAKGRDTCTFLRRESLAAR